MCSTIPRSGRHPQGYGSEKPGGKLVDITDQDPSRAWAAGQLISTPTCGGVAWGHGGDIDGFETRNGVTEDGRAATVAVTALPATPATMQHVIDAMDTALCDKR